MFSTRSWPPFVASKAVRFQTLCFVNSICLASLVPWWLPLVLTLPEKVEVVSTSRSPDCSLVWKILRPMKTSLSSVFTLHGLSRDTQHSWLYHLKKKKKLLLFGFSHYFFSVFFANFLPPQSLNLKITFGVRDQKLSLHTVDEFTKVNAFKYYLYIQIFILSSNFFHEH